MNHPEVTQQAFNILRRFVVSMTSYDWHPATQHRVIGALFGLDALLIVCAGVLRWI